MAATPLALSKKAFPNMIAYGKARIGIIGLGFVGGAVRAWYEKKYVPGENLFFYDTFKNVGSADEVNQADIIFVCVPTPYLEKKGYDDSAIRAALKSIRPGKIVVIKSTVLPGSTEQFQKQFPKLHLLFNPEFLVAKTAVKDFAKPDRQIVGYTKKSKQYAEQVLKLLPKAPYMRSMPATEAEMVKYFGNTYLALKVIFGNQIYDVCQKLGIDYAYVMEGGSKDQRIGSSHLDVLFDGYRGYGGACLPKDTKAFIDFAKRIGAPSELLETTDRLNERLRRHGKASR